MSASVFTTPGELPASFNRWDIPIKMGLLIGVISVLLSTVSCVLILPASYVGYLVSTAVIFVVSLGLYYITGARQRKAMGGYISLKEAFAAIFVAILISTIISTIWGLVYARIIDPQLPERIKEGTLAFMEGKVPQEKLDQTALDIDKQIGDSIKPGALLYAYAKSLVITSIFGFICAAIVRRAPKQAMM
jgi:hypothetical protein